MIELKHFSEDEFKCSCGCGKSADNMDVKLLRMLDTARELAGTGFIINSSIRCPEHNKAVGGSKASSHLLGLAVDIKATTSRERFLIIRGLMQAGFGRIGIGKSFIHVDLDKNKPDKVAWLY